MKKILFVLLLAVMCVAAAAKTIASDDKAILIEGALHVSFSDAKACIERIDPALFGPKDFRVSHSVSMAPSGVRIRFRTDSPQIRLNFERRPEGKWRESTWYYGVYCDGVFLADIPGGNPIIEAPSEGMHEYRIVLPIMNPELFCGITIDDAARLKPARKQRKSVYFAIGDSITHGTGQTEHGSQISWPFIVAENHGYELYNLAVGASQISPAIAQELKGRKADVITIMWGFNDWNATKGNMQEVVTRYRELLENLLQVQPKAKIYCVMYGETKVEEGKPGYGCTLPQLREALMALAREFASSPRGRRIHVIDGTHFITADGLADSCHMNNSGAAEFGSRVSAEL